MMLLPIQSGGGGWLLRAAMRSASAWAAARAASWAWYSTMPWSSSWDHALTCAAWAAWARWSRACRTTERRSYELSWVTATLAMGWVGGASRGKMMVARTTVQTATARSSGSKLFRSSLKSPYPWGAVQA